MKPGKHFDPYEPHEVRKSQEAVGSVYHQAGWDALQRIAELDLELTEAEKDIASVLVANRAAGAEMKRQLVRLRRLGTRSERASKQAAMAQLLNEAIGDQP